MDDSLWLLKIHDKFVYFLIPSPYLLYSILLTSFISISWHLFLCVSVAVYLGTALTEDGLGRDRCNGRSFTYGTADSKMYLQSTTVTGVGKGAGIL